MINKELLYKFFEAKTSPLEDSQVKAWIEESKENNSDFLKERTIYNSILLNKQKIVSPSKKLNLNKRSYWNNVLQIAAIFLLLFTGGLLFNNMINDKKEINDLTTVIVPPGQRINLILADNSSVWLNANSVFKYPTSFSKKKREVYLDGEGYFEVNANKKKPFVIKTPKGGIKVFGTTFNVSSYSKLNNFETSLFTGSLSVYSDDNEKELIAIVPSQKVVLTSQQLKVEEIKSYDDFLWRKGLIAFNDKQLHEIASILGQYFDVNIEIASNTITNSTYTGKFRQSDGVEYALRVLQKSMNFNYERLKNNQTIYIKD